VVRGGTRSNWCSSIHNPVISSTRAHARTVRVVDEPRHPGAPAAATRAPGRRNTRTVEQADTAFTLHVLTGAISTDGLPEQRTCGKSSGRFSEGATG
jgi:hypothetical protein